MRDTRRWWVASAGTLCYVVGLAGCAGSALQLHSVSREEQAKTAQEKWGAAFKAAEAVIESRRDNTRALLVQFDETSKAWASVKVGSELYSFAVADPSDKSPLTLRTALADKVDVALTSLGGTSKPALADLANPLDRALRHRQALREAQTEFAKLGGPADFSCDKWHDLAFSQEISKWRTDLAGREAGAVPAVVKAIAKIETECPTDPSGRGDSALRGLASELPAGTLKTEVGTLLAMWSGFDRAKDAHAVDRVALLNAVNDYRAALVGKSTAPGAAGPASAAASATGSNATTPVQEAGNKVSAALNKLRSANDLFSLKLLSEESTKGIDEFLASLESPKDASDPNATSRDRAALALVTLSRTSEDWKAAQAEIEAIGLRPLALVQSIEQLKLQRAQSGIAAKELAAELQAQKVRIRLKQEGAYLVAKKLSRGEQLTPFLDRTLQQAYYGDKGSSPLSVQQRKDLLRASGQYWYASGYLEQLANSLQTKLALLEELRKANESENSLKQWDALIRSQVDLLEVWSKTGVKADTISQGLNALLLIWIGLGVH